MIEVRHLRKVYTSTVAVADLSFRVPAGQTLALVGTSGSGKTTTLKMLNRLIEPSAGEILIEGVNARRLPLTAMRRRMGYVIQKIGLFPHYTVAENIAVVPRLLGWSAERTRSRSAELLERLGLPTDFLSRYPHELSGGQQQRVGIARALAADPPIILMDEPFSALDPITRQELRRDFRELEELQPKTVVLVTHDLAEAFQLADQICLLDGGELQQLGSPAQLLLRPQNDFVRQFIGDQRLSLSFDILRLAALQGLPPSPVPKPDKHVLTLSKNDTLAQAQRAFLATNATHARLREQPDFYFTPVDLQRLAWSKLRAQ
jgi:osmoprotectant transport system ATP-binding protein